ncbi:hypothetical protein [Ruegeria lacuscaerulensis]|uniref:hypothetical protein n=1 Tax=Ruegeria lacuscaerulensis TaxID=55218 RepID=UPI00147D7189|nr:hypothetical protein [Ruegeria lacuscaerulensis]
MKVVLLVAVLAVSACAVKPLNGSIPTQQGHTLASARNAVLDCTGEADEGGNSAVIGGYTTNVLLFGIILGPLVTVPMQDELRTQGEYDQVDRCLAERGFERRELTGNESAWLNNASKHERVRRLDHLVGGGTVESYSFANVQ